jgi:hypothetical protein
MSAVISGTNGLLQSYDYQVLTTGFTYTFAAGTQVLVMNPAGTLATGTVTMPAAPVDGMTITFSSSQQITALTMAGNGASLVGAVTFLPAKTGVTYVYRATGTTWVPTATVPGTGSQLVSGTAVASTSGTSIDFTGIPSWVKRITVPFSGVSVSGTSIIQLQLGDSGGVETTGYTSGGWLANTNVSLSTTGFLISGINVASYPYDGNIIICLVDVSTNKWSYSSVMAGSVSGINSIAGGSKSLSATLDRVRITTVNGTDTFDAGTINILYE